MTKLVYQKWLERVNYDMETAEAMYSARRYIYSVFMCQQAIEKCLKAYMVFKKIELVPVHNLRRLAEMAGIVDEINKDDLQRMDFLSQYYLNARYKEDVEELLSQITPEKAVDFLNFTREKIKWLTQKMRP